MNTGTPIRVPAHGDRMAPAAKEPARKERRRGLGAVDGMKHALTEVRTSAKNIRALAACGYSYRYRLLLLALLSPVQSIPSLLTPLIMQWLIDEAYPTRDLRLFAWLCVALLALRILPNTLSALSGYLSTYVQSLMQYKLCLRVFNAIQRLPLAYREEHGSGMFVERATRDVGALASSLTRLLPEIVTIVFTFLLAIPLMCRLDARITILILAIVPVNYAITVCLSRRLRALHETGRKIEEQVTTFTSETIDGATISRLFALGHMRRRKLKQLLRGHLAVTFAAWRASTFWGQLGGLAGLTWGMLLLCGGWYLVFIDRLQLGQAVALSMYVGVLARPFQEVGRLYQSLIKDSVAARRVLEILNTRRPGAQEGALQELTRSPRRFELRQVSFAYQEGRPCLHCVDLHLDGGRTVAVIGPSGAGKSTLIRILSGLDDRYHGHFLVDGQDFRGISRDSYLRHVSLVPQSTFFFSDTIRANLCAGNGSIAPGTLQRYADLLGLEELITAAPEGYDTLLGAEGIRLSAGQYQKLAVLRAILKDASILLLDEMTSSMDIESERRLLKGIVALRPQGCATLLVTHHIAVTTEPWIDEIVVMANGRIAERGSSAQLRDACGFYHHWLTLNQGVSLDRAMLSAGTAGQTCEGVATP